MSAKLGQPTKFSPGRAARIVRLIKRGNFIKVAHKAAGIGEGTYARWMNLGTSDAPEHAKHRQFRRLVRRARVAAETRSVQQIKESKTWTAHAWFLEKSFPDRWGNRSKTEVRLGGLKHQPVQIEVSQQYPPEYIASVIAILGGVEPHGSGNGHPQLPGPAAVVSPQAISEANGVSHPDGP